MTTFPDAASVDYANALDEAARYLERRAVRPNRQYGDPVSLAPDGLIVWDDLRDPMPALDPIKR